MALIFFRNKLAKYYETKIYMQKQKRSHSMNDFFFIPHNLYLQ